MVVRVGFGLLMLWISGGRTALDRRPSTSKLAASDNNLTELVNQNIVDTVDVLT